MRKKKNDPSTGKKYRKLFKCKFTFSVRQLGSQLWLTKRPKFPLALASITCISRQKQSIQTCGKNLQHINYRKVTEA